MKQLFNCFAAVVDKDIAHNQLAALVVDIHSLAVALGIECPLKHSMKRLKQIINKINSIYTNFVVVDMALQTAVSLRRDCNHSAEEAVDNNMAVFVVGKGLGQTVD